MALQPSASARERAGVTMRGTLVFAAIGEIVTGAALLLAPSWVGQLLLGSALTGTAVTVAQVAGIALIALGVACWPGPPRRGMLLYSAGVTLYLAYVGWSAAASGLLLWPVVVLHLILTALLIRESARDEGTKA